MAPQIAWDLALPLRVSETETQTILKLEHKTKNVEKFIIYQEGTKYRYINRILKEQT